MTLVPVALIAALLSAAPSDKAPFQRFAFVVGSNDGGPGRLPLRYATSDAQTVIKVLDQMGGIPAENRILLANPSRSDFLVGLSRIQGLLEAARPKAERVELVLYYSGHSDETGLLLGKEQLGYSELRAALNNLSADVRIAVLDSCSSGALLRAKGGRHVAPFLIDGSTAVRGHAFLTATSEEEAAQESDGIRGSYFTYALLSGLRGAADASRDGKVTLNEAYQFAYNETLNRTERSRGGPQHPAFDIQLVGTGDLVLTDLRGSSAGLVLAPEIDGRIWLRDANGNLVAELRKVGGYPMELGLEPGTYGVTVETNGKVFASQVALADGKRAELSEAKLLPVKPEAVTLRGTAHPPTRIVLANLSLVPPLTFNPSDGPVLNYFAFNALLGRSAKLHGLEIGLGINTESEEVIGAQIGLINMVEGSVTGLQISELLNITGAFAGVQLGALGNDARGEVVGAQISDGFNIADAFTGAQMTAGFNWASASSRGAQISTGFNVATAGLAGVQITTGFNVAQSAALQMSSGVNVARESAMQVGTLNIARQVSGVQLGVVNIAEHSDYPIGLINIIGDGYHVVSLSSSNVVQENLEVKVGGRRLYALLGVGLRGYNNNYSQWMVQSGIGVHLDWTRRWLTDVDLSSSRIVDGFFEHVLASQLYALRVTVGLRLVRDLAIVFGPSLNLMVSQEGTNLDWGEGVQKAQKTFFSGDTTFHVFPGGFAGIQY